MTKKLSGPLFKWFGSKWNASLYYPEPKHDTIVEPYAGAAGYSSRHSDLHVVLYESNPQLVSLWTFLIRDATEAGIRSIPVGLSKGTDIRSIGLPPGEALLLKMWQRTNNVGECWTISPWGNSPGQWTENTRARVAEEVELVKHWECWADGQAAFCDFYAKAVTWFIDPPYQHNYKYKSKTIDYASLAIDISIMSGQIIVCEARAKDGTPPDWLPFSDWRRTVTSRRKTSDHHHSSEMIFLGNK